MIIVRHDKTYLMKFEDKTGLLSSDAKLLTVICHRCSQVQRLRDSVEFQTLEARKALKDLPEKHRRVLRLCNHIQNGRIVDEEEARKLAADRFQKKFKSSADIVLKSNHEEKSKPSRE